MKIAVIGAGGVGGYFGGRLAQKGEEVTFVARGEHGAALSSKGMEVKSINGDFTLPKVQVMDHIRKLQDPDLILLAVKSWQVKEIRDEVKEILKDNTLILPLQNGVMAVEELSETIDKQHIISGLCRIISQVAEPGVINHFGAQPSIVIGEIDNPISNRLKAIEALFTLANIDLKVSNDIESELWKKFIMICLSGLQAVTRATLGEMRNNPANKQMMHDLLVEVYGLSQHLEIKIDSNYVDKTLTFLDTLPDNTTFSLARDVWDGKPSEMEYQNGTVVKLGERHGFKTPINQFIYSCLLPNELKVRQSD